MSDATSKVMSMQRGDRALRRTMATTLVIEGFTHLICFAAAHEIIRQRRRDLTLCRLTPDLIYDQMIAAGCAPQADLLVGGQSRASARCTRCAARSKNAIRNRWSLKSTRTSVWSRVSRPAPRTCRSGRCAIIAGSDLPAVNPLIRSVNCPYTGEAIATVPALNPDVTIVHAQRADANGDTQIWGFYGVQKEAAFAAKRVIVVVEEIVAESVVRADPNRTLIPGIIVNAVVHEPWGAHPSYAQGYYDRDNDFYVDWEDDLA